jgi:hypothetical protein
MEFKEGMGQEPKTTLYGEGTIQEDIGPHGARPWRTWNYTWKRRVV